MDRNSVIGLLLIGVVLIGFMFLNQPSKEQLEAMKHQRDSIAAVDSMNLAAKMAEIKKQQEAAATVAATAVPDSLANNDSSIAAQHEQMLGVFAAAGTGTENFRTLENELVKIEISSKGGRVYSAQLKKYKTFEGKPLVLFDGDSSAFGFNFFAQNKAIATNHLFFSLDTASITDTSIALKLNAGADKFIRYTYTLPANSYQLKLSVQFKNVDDLIAANSSYIDLDWRQPLLKQEKDIENERLNSTIYYKYSDDEVDYLSTGTSGLDDLKTKIKWVAFKQHFFTSVLIAESSFDKPTKIESIVDESSPEYVISCKANFTIPYFHKADESFDMSFYYGPNHYQVLNKQNLGLEEIINLGFFGFVNKWLVIPVFNWLNSFNLNFGIIILILTIIIRIVLLPLTYKSFISQAKMKVLQPEVNELNEKFKDDPMKKQQEMMGLYRKAGVNPLGGCIPALLQIPILFAMFSFFPTSIELRQESFLWAKDLSTYDSILDLPFTIPFYGDHVSLFTILMTLSTILFTAINMQMTTAVNPQMKWMMYLMPIMFLGVFNSYSAGLSYYYFLSNLCGLGQQYLFKAFVNQDEIHRKIQEQKKKPVTKSKFQQRLEDMAKQRGYKMPKK